MREGDIIGRHKDDGLLMLPSGLTLELVEITGDWERHKVVKLTKIEPGTKLDDDWSQRATGHDGENGPNGVSHRVWGLTGHIPVMPGVSHNALTVNTQARKLTPIFSGVLRYFPRALAAVAALSQIGNEQHNPGTPLHWDRSKSGDELDALTRHLLEAGSFDTDGVRHSTKVAWRALANLEKELEACDKQAPSAGDVNVHPDPDAGPGY
jgi:Domain of unknown function (DUF5664)